MSDWEGAKRMARCGARLHSPVSLLLALTACQLLVWTARPAGGQRMQSYPSPDFTTSFTMSSQAGSASFKQVAHGLGKRPFRVRVYATPTKGNNKGFVFEGQGSAQSDDTVDGYGGLVFGFDATNIRIWAPSKSFGNSLGRIIFVKDGWGGEQLVQEEQTATVVVNAWMDGPTPSYTIPLTGISAQSSGCVSSYKEVQHGLQILPKHVMVRVEAVDGSNKGYHFYGIGSGQSDDDAGSYGGVVYAYDENRVRVWVPCKNPSNSGNTLGRMIFVGDGWANGFMLQSSLRANIHIDLWVDDWPIPTYQSPWITLKPQNGAGSYRLLTHDLGVIPDRVQVQVKATGSNNKNFVFEAQGSAMSTDTKNRQYGGLVFAYNETVIRLWAPDVNDGVNSGYIIFIKDGWGGEVNWQQSVSAAVRVLMWRSCPAGQKAVGGGCVNTELTHRSWVYSDWSNCSVICNAGTQVRTVAACTAGTKRVPVQCDFDKDNFCGFQKSTGLSVLVASWFLRKDMTPSSLTGPNYDHTTGSGYYAFVESSGKNKNAVGTLTSPSFVGDQSCIVYFFWNLYGLDIGTLQVDGLVVGKTWQNDLWNMTHNQGNSWRLGAVRMTVFEPTPATSQIRFRMYLGGPTTQQFVTWQSDAAIDDVKIVCDALPTASVNMSKAACEANTYPTPGCVVRVDKPDQTGGAYKLYASTAKPTFYYLKPSGRIWWRIASWKFSVPTSGRYVFWMRVTTYNIRQSIRVQLNTFAPQTWYIPTALTWQWVAFSPSFLTVSKGTHTISLIQFNTTAMRVREIMLLPQSPTTYGELGLQSNLVSDGALTASSNLSSCPVRTARLHSAGTGTGGWCSSVLNTAQTLTVTLTRPALIYKIATQGRQDAAQWTKSFQFSYSLHKSKPQPYLEGGGAVKTFFANSDQNTVKVSLLWTPVLADKLVFNPKTWNGRPALRLELYGDYIDSGQCASPGSAVLKQSCTGDGVCNNGTCPKTGATCQCNTGYYSNRCVKNYCDGVNCLNNGTCMALRTTSTCQCQPGWDGLLCDRTCSQGFWGDGCTSACQCSNRGTCDPVFGKCTCDAGYQGLDCGTACPTGLYGLRCQLSCLCKHASRCDNVNGTCTCLPGYKGMVCDTPCAANEWGANCDNKCTCRNGGACEPVNGTCYCPAGFVGLDCEQNCTAGTFGFGCASTCQCQNGALCSPVDGTCTCTQPGFYGPLCSNKCTSGRFGLNCLNSCMCVNGACDRANGTCYCNAGWEGSKCDKACRPGRYGADCTGICTCMNGAQCSSRDGSCSCAQPTCICSAGWTGSECRTACNRTRWGPDCANTCLCQHGGKCSRFNGSCDCQVGFHGRYCEKACAVGSFGYQCASNCTCSAGNTVSCRKTDGFCTCSAGWQGNDCDQVCSSGSYGVGCNMSCQCQNGGVCHPVDGSCACKDGFTAPDCSVPCIGGYYGPHCTQRCRCANAGICNSVTGACKCTVGWYGLYCDTQCRDGYWGLNCQQNCTCAHGSTCRHTDGACQCTAGWKGTQCNVPCPVSTYGLNCTNACPPCYHGNGTCHADTGFCSCPPGVTGLYCSKACPSDTWGIGCAGKCSCSKGSVCNPVTGKCQCPSGKSGPLCTQNCGANTYGPGCAYKCNCIRGNCSSLDGSCSCPDGYVGSLCNQVCATGWYGPGCTKRCRCLHNGRCDPVDGSCTCSAGWTGPICSTVCPRNTYGVNCASQCRCKNSAICNRVDGSCLCTAGWVGPLCDQDCPFGFYGTGCRQPCACRHNSSCDHITGQCSCTSGYQGVNCSQLCSAGTFGMGCQQACNCHLPNAVGAGCDAATGHCSCKSGYYKQCQVACPPGRFGANCTSLCQCQNNATCDFLKGTCTCGAGYGGALCDQECPAFTYGPYCQGNCSCVTSNTQSCSSINGACICAVGYTGLACEQVCQAKYYGAGCSQPCNCSGRESSCHHMTGDCVCQPGWTGVRCEKPCPTGTFGISCSSSCSCNNGATCHHITGACTCAAGYQGTSCAVGCKAGTFGVGCTQSCKCNMSTSDGCDPMTGSCSCLPGYVSNQGLCNDTCPPGLWGAGCTTQCPVCAPYITSHCRSTDGVCMCAPGFTGFDCDNACGRSYYGQNCAKSCDCSDDLLCNNADGRCQDISKAKFDLLFKTSYKLLKESKSMKVALIIAMDQVLDKELFENPLASVDPAGHIVVTFQDNTIIPTNDGSAGDSETKDGSITETPTAETTSTQSFNDSSSEASSTSPLSSASSMVTSSMMSPSTAVQSSVTGAPIVGRQRIYSFNNSIVVRILSVMAAEVMGQPVSKVEFVVLYKGIPYPSAIILDLLGNISTSQLDSWLGHQVVRQGGSIATTSDSSTDSGSALSQTLIIIIACSAGGVLLAALLTVVVVRRVRKQRDRKSLDHPEYGVVRVPASSVAGMSHKTSTTTMMSSVSFTSSAGSEPVVLMNSGPAGMSVGGRNSSHLCFDNPYYDVMAAMAIDDDMDNDFINPLYGKNMALNAGL